MATKIRNTNKPFHAPVLPQPPAEYNQSLTIQRDAILRIFFANVDDALSRALQYDSDDIIDGSIPNSKLENSTVSFGGVTLALGGVDATPAFNLVDATGYPTSSLVGTIATAQIADDAVTDAKLADSINSAITANTAKVTNATHTGEVTGATALTIADNVVDEANLKVSNAPVNGYFLSAQSGNTGGLTWAQVSSGISAVVDDTTPQLGGNLDANNKDIHSVDQLSIGTSTLSHDFLISGYKTSEEGELFKVLNNNSSSSADGRMITFYASSNHRGSLGYTNVTYGSGTFFAGPGCGLLATTQFSSHIVQPCDQIGARMLGSTTCMLLMVQYKLQTET